MITKHLLSEFLPSIKNFSYEELSKAFFEIGIEEEKHEFIIAPEGLFYGVIKDCSKLTGSDKLTYCKVYIPVKDQTFGIVCGAKNVRTNLRVLVALPSSKLLNNTIQISSKKIFGTLSEGMICSYSELYKSNLLDKSKDDVEGIIEFSDNWDICKKFNPEDLYLNDLIFDLTIPYNRPDLYSVWGIAQELRKKLNIKESIRFQIYSQSQDLWHLKRVLLVNNQICSEKYEENLNFYVYLSFNEVFIDNKNLFFKKKSPYFLNLLKEYLDFLGVKNDLQPQEVLPKKIFINFDWICNFLCISSEILKNIFESWKSFDFCFGDGYVEVPKWRNDLSNCRDICEEILRYFSFNRIEEKSVVSGIYLPNNDYFLALEAIKNFWRDKGFFECTTFNLHSKNESEISILNSVSEEHVSLRKNAIPELLKVLEKNYSRKRELHPIFEIFETHDCGWILNLVIPEPFKKFTLNSTFINNDLYDLQSLLKRMFVYLNQDIYFSEGTSKSLFLNPNFLLINDSKKGFMGYLSSSLPFKVLGAVVHLDMDIEKPYLFSPLSKFPSSFKDISIEFKDSDLKVGEVIKNLKSDFLKKVEVIDRYKSDDSISYLFRCEFQSLDRTLTRMDIERELNTLYSILNRFDVKIR